MSKNQEADPDMLTHNRYGCQLGEKVPLLGTSPCSSGDLVQKTIRSEWLKRLPKVKRCTLNAGEPALKRPKAWHDNEKFLQSPTNYKANGMESVTFPPNSGDSNPIETVWARLRKDLASREFEDLQNDKVFERGAISPACRPNLEFLRSAEGWAKVFSI